MDEWEHLKSDAFVRDYNKLNKKNPQELTNVMINFVTFFTALSNGAKVQHIKAGFIHKEPSGIKAIDQSGSDSKGLKETRLYIYPDESTKICHLICIGFKKGQPKDIQSAKKFVKKIKE